MSKSDIDPQALVRMGKGQFARTRPPQCAAWLGAQTPSRPLFNPAQAEENKVLYPHLFHS